MRRIALASAALWLCLSLDQPDLLSAQALRIPYTTFTLPNGLQVIVHEDHSVPVVAVNTWYHVGSSDERPGRTGFAHLFEHRGAPHDHRRRRLAVLIRARRLLLLVSF